MSDLLSHQRQLARLELAAALTGDEEHARPEEIDAVVSGTATPSVRSRLEQHVRVCLMCAGEMDDLQALARRAKLPRRILLAAAAAVLLAAFLGPVAWSRMRDSADQRYADVSIPAEIVAMKGERLLLRGASASSGFGLVEPLATAVVSDRPTFVWTAPPGAAVSVQVFNEAFHPLARSESTTAREWIPPQPLPREKTLIWQIVVEDPAGRKLAPAPPLPEARFRVISEDDARRLAAIAGDTSGPSLRLASAYAQLGALDDARRELSRLAASGGLNDASRRLLERVDNVE